MGERIEAIKSVGAFILMFVLAIPACVIGSIVWFIHPSWGNRFGDWYIDTLDRLSDYPA